MDISKTMNGEFLPAESKEVSLGIDVRGKRIGLGVVSRSGQVLSSQLYPYEASSVFDFIDRLLRNVQEFLDFVGAKWEIKTAGVGIGGWVDWEDGIWRYTKKIPNFRDPVPLAALIEKRTGLKVKVDNDIHVSSLAEMRYGIGKSFSNFLYYHIGSGIAVGVVANGQLLRGTANYSGECGQCLFDIDGSDNFVTLESFASGAGMISFARSLFSKYPNSILIDADKKGELFSSTIFKGSLEGDELSTLITEKIVKGIGLSVVNLLSITNSEALVFGGGVMSNGFLLPKLIEFIKEHASLPTIQMLSYIGTSRLGADEVGLIGAACLTWEYGF